MSKPYGRAALWLLLLPALARADVSLPRLLVLPLAGSFGVEMECTTIR